MELTNQALTPVSSDTLPTHIGVSTEPESAHLPTEGAGGDAAVIEQFLDILKKLEGAEGGAEGGEGSSSPFSGSISANPNPGAIGGAFGGGDGTQSPFGTDPTTNPLGQEGGEGAQATTETNDAGQADFADAIKDLHSKDQGAFDQFQKDANDGNGNAMVNDIIADYKNGDLTKDQANSLALDVQQVANVNGGGKINKNERHEFQDALGNSGDVITSGHTKGADWWKEHGSQFLDGLGLAAQIGAQVATKV